MPTSDPLKPVAIVTGAGAPRIGNCVARTLAERGYQLAIHANRSQAQAEATARELEEAGAKAITIRGDLSKENDVRQMVHAVVEEYGHIEALVNSAGIFESSVLEEVAADDVRSHFNANTLTTFLCCQKVQTVKSV